MDENKEQVKIMMEQLEQKMDGKLEQMEQKIMEDLMGGSLKLIRCLKGLVKIKVVFMLNNFLIIRILKGDLTPIMELLMDGLQKE
jgi:hypothetical protein